MAVGHNTSAKTVGGSNATNYRQLSDKFGSLAITHFDPVDCTRCLRVWLSGRGCTFCYYSVAVSKLKLDFWPVLLQATQSTPSVYTVDQEIFVVTTLNYFFVQ